MSVSVNQLLINDLSINFETTVIAASNLLFGCFSGEAPAVFILPLIMSSSFYFNLLIWIGVSCVVQYELLSTMDYESNH